MTFRIGVIGCGWVSTACHGPAYREYASLHPEVELAACCDTDATRVEAFRAAFHFQRGYQNFKEMLDTEQLDVVCLNVPPALTCAIGCIVLQRHIPLLAEKPPGLTTQELDLLIEAAQAGNVPHQVAFNRRYAPLTTEIKRLIGNLPVSHIDYTLARVDRNHEDFTTTAIHAIDTTRFLAGEDFREARIDYQERMGAHGLFLNYQLHGIFLSGASFHITICPSTGISIERATLYCTDHTFFLSHNNGPDAPGRIQYYLKDQFKFEVDAATFCNRRENYYLNGFYHEDAEFFDLVRTGSHAAHDFRSAYQSVALMQALRERKPTFSSSEL
jgi:myo-inositol 2-dehydrogenase / D-chiro-inositol 1-dehydrogenase